VKQLTAARRIAAERLPSEVAKASKEIPSQERRQMCINRAMHADCDHHAAKGLEPPATIDRQSPAAVAVHVFQPRRDGIRDAAALARLPAEERAACEKL
jgi:hypothetical protein